MERRRGGQGLHLLQARPRRPRSGISVGKTERDQPGVLHCPERSYSHRLRQPLSRPSLDLFHFPKADQTAPLTAQSAHQLHESTPQLPVSAPLPLPPPGVWTPRRFDEYNLHLSNYLRFETHARCRDGTELLGAADTSEDDARELLGLIARLWDGDDGEEKEEVTKGEGDAEEEEDAFAALASRLCQAVLHQRPDKE